MSDISELFVHIYFNTASDFYKTAKVTEAVHQLGAYYSPISFYKSLLGFFDIDSSILGVITQRF